MAANDQNDDGHDTGNLPDLGDAIDIVTFSQILEMDDSEDDREFSKSIVFGFFEQAEETFEKMDMALEARNLDELYRLGHFLKGSSATLGLTKVKDSCEKIQRYGKKENLDGSPEKDETLCLSRITETLKTVKSEYADVELTLKNFFNST
ncbi:histidine-phosphotransfer domain, HPT domain-containing protein [Daldinia loculata]|uniref:histidine-phosphotransfer domain, HPT domain-containing protein n=1 Tax=Daldinia loculata TaxID=103429 RepID=UPI0020C2AF1A|nr:histidine-phosphotransfer domain, HPT domain-containing protein [Daldinia loculata]KAI1646476.1 histidine-phosphotransfer domain, HPT domain-containing protein [Daldinia loculata]KAI2779193.1 histidine-phosphotransfer domain, HPT domain-containing protein [Daldinia loculata]